MSDVATRHPLEERLGYIFAEPRFLVEALTHSTFANENPESGPPNERLEFLGDAVLDLLVGHLLFGRYGEAQEGELSRRRARVVCTDTLATLAEKLNLIELLRLGLGQLQSPGKTSRRTLAGAYEAVVAAVYLDGGMVAVERCFGPVFLEAISQSEEPTDYKTRLQELCHARGSPGPRYQVAKVDGPDHARRYTCQVHLGDALAGQGEAPSKKAAEQICAEHALRYLSQP